MHQLIAGRRREGGSAETFEVTDPTTGQTVETVRLADAADVGAVVRAAREAFPAWSSAPPVERSAALTRLAGVLEGRADEIARTETRQTDKAIRLSTGFDVPGTVDNVAFFAGAARSLEGKAAGEYSGDHTSYVRREPLGVVGSVAPWNYPLQMAAWKVLPAIAARDTIVLKPAELTPLTALMFAEAAQAAGVPDGVVNVVTGSGSLAGEALIAHPEVDMVSFTCSSAVGRRVMEVASKGPKRGHLELAGKAPFLVFDDADLEAAVHAAVAGALINTGQDCTAATRAYVQRPFYDAFVSGVADVMGTAVLGEPLDERTDQGPSSRGASRRGWRGSWTGPGRRGPRSCEGEPCPAATWRAAPTTSRPSWSTRRSSPRSCRTRCSGPSSSCCPSTPTTKGCASPTTRRTASQRRPGPATCSAPLRATREIRAGCVWVNDHIPIISEMPHGGYKASGFGKDMSSYYFDDYAVVKHVKYDGTAVARKPWHRTVFGGPADHSEPSAP